MVADSGKALRADTLKPVNIPEPVTVTEDGGGRPAAVKIKRSCAVQAIEDSWRLDDEWWRSQEISRMYYTVLLASGQKIVLYKDLAAGAWYRQGY